MKEIKTIDEIKRIQLDILKYVISFCEANEIKFFVGYGTLIGAVRHKGFIPWDDDIDIVLRRSDYDRFIDLFSKETGRYKIWSHKIQKKYPLPYAKVTDEDTLKIEEANSVVMRGIDIDVFPIDDLPDNEDDTKMMFKRLKFWDALLNLKQIKVDSSRSSIKNIILLVARCLLCFLPLSYIVENIHRNARSFEGCNGEKCAQMVAYIYKEKEIQAKKFTDNTVYLPFEDLIVPVPAGYNEYLRQIYGDYMKLPPKEKQITHHSYVAYWKD